MKEFLRHTSSLILPVAVLVVIPLLIETEFILEINIWFVSGILFIICGLVMMVHTIGLFIKIGRGTLAPWDPTRHLVIIGMYRYVRNPMISGVFIVLIGEALLFRSVNITIWAALFFLINTAYFILSEEPGLLKRFGKEYSNYKKNVPRWIPRFTPWKPDLE